ncbi:hypothetical protein [Hyperthermus butylicus]|uniref:hypothetical protein n=1 Tax=Hyperthermus butylicus TaxID=54248 RepID=UPI00064EB4A7
MDVPGKVKTNIMVDRELWEAFKRKIVSERGPRFLSSAVEEALEEELAELFLLKALDSLDVPGDVEAPPSVVRVRLRVATRAEDVVRELREGRY